MRASLTYRQEEVYKFIVRYLRENGFSPTIREIQDHFEFSSTNSVVIHLNNLMKKGYLMKLSKENKIMSRSIRLVDDVVGNYVIDGKFLNEAMKRFKERGYSIDINTAVEFLKELKVKII